MKIIIFILKEKKKDSTRESEGRGEQDEG